MLQANIIGKRSNP